MPDLLLGDMPDPLSMPEAPILEELEHLAGRVEGALGHRYTPFPANGLPEDWTVDKVRAARKLHDQGQFWHTTRLERVTTTDPRVQGALSQRVATPIGLPLRVKPAAARGGRGVSETARAECEAMFALGSPSCPPSTRRRLLQDCVMAGVAIGQNVWRPNAAATRWNVRVERWPLEYAIWDPSINRYRLMTTEGLLTIEHGHGKWIIFEPHGPQSWLMGAIRALAMPWADRTYGVRFRSQHAAAHGSPVPVGQLPSGVQIGSKEGKLFQRFVTALLTMRVGGVRPFGSVIDYLEPKTSAWQVFDSIVKNSDDDIDLCLLGQNATTKKGGVYSSPMFDGVRFDLVELDVRTLDVGFQSGMVGPWSAVNFGTEFTPTLETVVPDPEEDQRIDAVTKRVDAFARAVVEFRGAQFEVTDDFLSVLGDVYGLGFELPKLRAIIAAAPGAAPAPGAPTPAPAPPPTTPKAPPSEQAA